MRSPLLILAFLFAAGTAPPAADAFDAEAYLRYLAEIRDLEAHELLDARSPFGPYRFELESGTTHAFYSGVQELLNLTPDERTLLDRHGFVVSERLSYPSFGHALLEVWEADLPVFISTDAILHALHRSYVNLLVTVETGFLIANLEAVLTAMHEAWPQLEKGYGDDPVLRPSLDDVDVYLTVARNLLAGARVHSSLGGNQEEVETLLDLIDAEGMAYHPLFNEAPRAIDFSQFKPRGHYAGEEILRRYFRAMIWLGRTEFRLTEPPGIPVTPDVSREIRGAFLVRELVQTAGVEERLGHADALIASLVGPSDNVTLDELDKLDDALGLDSAADLADPGVMVAFREELASGGYRAQGILSQILVTDPMHPELLDPPYAFLLLGQRFILDSYVAGQVVFDRIEYQGSRIFRELPDPLDVLYALGNDDVLPLLEEELDTYHYSANLAALRYLIDGYEPEFWEETLYSSWLQAVRALSHTGRQEGAPEFMTTGAWQQEKMNTQLASWAELRHDNLLYAKQSYTAGISCSFPCGYVEPVPEFYAALERYAVRAREAFGLAPLDSGTSDRLDRYFEQFGTVMGTLRRISEKELSGETLDEAELQFLEEPLFLKNGGCGDVESGWYRQLFFEGTDNPTRDEDLVIADVHTAPTDAAGNMKGTVLHAATGHPQMGVFTATPPGGEPTAFTGPVSAYHEHVTTGFTRLTDGEWKEIYASGPAGRPDWTYVYLADGEGKGRTGGRLLVDGPTPVLPDVEPEPVTPVLSTHAAPNPFTDTAVISFRIEAAGRSPVTLEILDARGRLVRRVIETDLRSGTYHARWTGDTSLGEQAAPGVYFARVRSGPLEAVQKIVRTP